MDKNERLERMKQGKIYQPFDKEIFEKQLDRLELLYEYNHTRPHEAQKRRELLKKMFAEIGEDCYFEPPLHSNWAGKNVYVGNSVYANFNFTLVDDGDIFIGDNCMFAPGVIIATASHPIEPELRRKAYQFNVAVRICSNVWIGAGAVVLPGVTIGDNSVIGAGSIVTKDIPPNVVAVGNPCRVMREISERDRIYYYRDRKIDL